MTFVRPTLSTIVDRVRADLNGRLPGADSRLARSLLDVLARVHSGALHGAYGYLDAIADDVMPDSADLDHLRRWATIWDVDEKVASTASGSVSVTGASGAIVPAASLLQRADGVEYVTGLAADIDDSGAATVAVTAVAAGAAGNAVTGTALSFVSPALGVGASGVVAAGGLTGGQDDEAPASLLARLLARIQTPPQGGAASDYKAWALAQPEVTRAWVYPGWTGAGTVGVAVVMDGRDDIFPTNDDIAAIQAAIDVLRPVTATVVVFAPTAMPTDFTLSVSPSTGTIQAAVAAELADLFAREAAPGGTLLLSHVREAIAEAAGVNDYTLLVPAGNVVAPAGFMPTLGNFVWTD